MLNLRRILTRSIWCRSWQDGFSNGAWANVTGFVPYEITGCSGSGNNCYVQGHFVPGYADPTGTGVSGKYTGDPSKRISLVN